MVARWMQWNGFERGLGYTMKLDILLFISCGRRIISQRLPSLKSRIQILYCSVWNNMVTVIIWCDDN